MHQPRPTLTYALALAQKHMSAFVGQFDLDDADGVNL